MIDFIIIIGAIYIPYTYRCIIYSINEFKKTIKFFMRESKITKHIIDIGKSDDNTTCCICKRKHEENKTFFIGFRSCTHTVIHDSCFDLFRWIEVTFPLGIKRKCVDCSIEIDTPFVFQKLKDEDYELFKQDQDVNPSISYKMHCLDFTGDVPSALVINSYLDNLRSKQK